MLTMRAVDPAIPVLVGDLRQHRRGPIRRRPYLRVAAWCPSCRDDHPFDLPDVFPLDAVAMVPAPCHSGPWAGSTIAVALDPGRIAEHRRVAADFAASLRRWEVERRLSRQPAEERLREWGGG